MSTFNLDITNEGLRVGGRVLLQPQSITMNQGQSVALIGRNGSGKSCLLRQLIGDSTHINITQNGVSQRDFSWLPQTAEFPKDFTVRELVCLGRFQEHQGFPTRYDWELCDHWIERIGLIEKSQHRIAQLSGGQQQMVSIARTVCSERSIVVMDEPFSNLDLANREILQNIIEKLTLTKSLVLYSLHGLDLLAWQKGGVLAIDLQQNLQKYLSRSEITREGLSNVFGVDVQVDESKNVFFHPFRDGH